MCRIGLAFKLNIVVYMECDHLLKPLLGRRNETFRNGNTAGDSPDFISRRSDICCMYLD